MKSAAVLVFAGLAAAQFSQLPTCAQSCANTYLQKGIGNCGVDVKCICSDSDFIAGIACCLAKPGGCDTADQSSAVVFASQLCAAQGVTVPTAVVCTATSSGASGASAASATPTSSTAATATDATPASTAAGTTATGTSATGTAATGTAATGTTATGTTATTAAAATTSSAANFAARESVAGAGIVGGIVAALAML